MLIDGITSDVLPATDRGLAYGDGLFETIRLNKGKLLFLDEHLERLSSSCKTLLLKPDLPQIRLWLNAAVASAPADGVIKLMLTRGSGGRGYQIPDAATPRCIISSHPLPVYSTARPNGGFKAFVCRQRLAAQPQLAGIKHLNRLEQVLASAEFPDATYQEGLMLDYSNNIIEGTRSNVFISLHGKLLTPSLNECGIAGIMRRKLLELFGNKVEVASIDIEQLSLADEIFFVNSVVGIWPVTQISLTTEQLQFPIGPHAHAASEYFQQALAI